MTRGSLLSLVEVVERFLTVRVFHMGGSEKRSVLGCGDCEGNLRINNINCQP